MIVRDEEKKVERKVKSTDSSVKLDGEQWHDDGDDDDDDDEPRNQRG
jgi:hypothetical protein